MEPVTTARTTYLGINCPCAACMRLTPQERLAKYDRIMASRLVCGKTRAAQPSMAEARSAGFWATMERQPFFARKWLKKCIKEQARQRAGIEA
jgi:hypothetical protein